jgi:Ca2+-transporting ATPase
MPRAEAAGGFAPWTKTVAAVEKHFGTSVATGLTTQQVAAARARYGYNELDKEAGKPLWKLVLEQFDDPLVKARAEAAAALALRHRA